MKFRLKSPFGSASALSRSNSTYVQTNADGSLQTPVMHKYENGKSATHGADPRVAQHLVATKTDQGWDIRLIKERVQITDNLAGEELVARGVTENREFLSNVPDERAVAAVFSRFTKDIAKFGYSPEPEMQLDVVPLPIPSAEIIRPSFGGDRAPV